MKWGINFLLTFYWKFFWNKLQSNLIFTLSISDCLSITIKIGSIYFLKISELNYIFKWLSIAAILCYLMTDRIFFIHIRSLLFYVAYCPKSKLLVSNVTLELLLDIYMKFLYSPKVLLFESFAHLFQIPSIN